MNLGEFYSANTHVNSITGCVIWDGTVVKGVPIVEGAVKIHVRKYVYESINGPQAYRTKFVPSCENPHCVKLEHIETQAPEVKPSSFPMEKVTEAWKLYSEDGMRQEAIATKLGVDPSTVSKYIRIAKANLQTTEAQGED